MEINPQTLIEELSRRLGQVVVENTVLAAQIRELSNIIAMQAQQQSAQQEVETEDDIKQAKKS